MRPRSGIRASITSSARIRPTGRSVVVHHHHRHAPGLDQPLGHLVDLGVDADGHRLGLADAGRPSTVVGRG